MTDILEKLKANISKVLIGKDDTVELLAIALAAGGHVLLEDVPGTGKTMLARTLARSIDGDFKRIQLTPDILPSDITGIQFFNPKTQEFEIRTGPVLTNVLLTDEINRATPRTQSALLEVMEEQQVTIEGERVAIDSPFIVLATQNPVEQQGTFPLPEAQMDRFLMQIKTGYPQLEEERLMLQLHREEAPIESIQPVVTKEDILELRRAIKTVTLSSDVEDYLLQIVHATRNHELVETGVSPRGAIAFMKAAQARAYLQGRSFVIPDDLKLLAPHILSHRIMLTMEGELRMTKKGCLMDILRDTEVPVEAGAE